MRGIGEEGQRKIESARVLVIGTGGLGSPVCEYLAGAGVGEITVVDCDRVERSNLPRQTIHTTSSIGMAKAESAARRMAEINSNTKVMAIVAKVDEENIGELVRNADFVIDCVDNFHTKYVINDECVSRGVAFAHGGAQSWGGRCMTYIKGSACLRCVFENEPEEGGYEKPSETGVIGSVVGMAGCVLATECIKYLTGCGELLTDRVMLIDGESMDIRVLKTKKNGKCMCLNDSEKSK